MLCLPVHCGYASVLHHPLTPSTWNAGTPVYFQVVPVYYSDCILSSALAAAARPLYDILEMLLPSWPQSANETVEDWPVNSVPSLPWLKNYNSMVFANY